MYFKIDPWCWSALELVVGYQNTAYNIYYIVFRVFLQNGIKAVVFIRKLFLSLETMISYII